MITVQQLTKRFTSPSGDVLAVDRLDFSVAAGEVYGLLGPNGAGKTTTLRMVLGLVKPDSGFAAIDDVRTSDAPDEIKRRVGFVSAGAGLYQWLTGREMLDFFADVYGLSPDRTQKSIDHLASVFDLRSFLDRRCTTLSTGQKQRLNLARALIHDPPIMMLDEPTRGLDVVGSKQIFDYVGELRERKKAVIISTHRLDEAERLCDRFGLLYRGRLSHEGSLEELRAQTGCQTITEIFLRQMDSSDSLTESST